MDALKRFFEYFFGAGETEEFTNFSLAHFLPIILAAGIVYLIYRYQDKIRAWKHEKTLCLAIALVMIICEMSYFWRLVGVPSLNPNPVDHLPITVCGWGVILGSYMMVTKSQSLFDIVYFWLFSGTIFALLTPTVITYTGPLRFRYYQFWIEHTIGYIAIFYMIFVQKLRPTVKSAIRSYAWFAVLAVVAFFCQPLDRPRCKLSVYGKTGGYPFDPGYSAPQFRGQTDRDDRGDLLYVRTCLPALADQGRARPKRAERQRCRIKKKPLLAGLFLLLYYIKNILANFQKTIDKCRAPVL